MLEGYMGLHISELAGIIENKRQHVIILGDAVLLHKNYLKERLGPLCDFAPVNLLHQKASSAAMAALVKIGKEKVGSCYELVPFYLRKSQAEREMDKKNV
jgi:tRNA threonylcarbamoyladenosine biosynthesis protein TsaB